MKVLFLAVVFILVTSMALSAVSYLLFFHGQITRPRIERLLGLNVAASDNHLSMKKVGSHTFLVGEEFGFRGRLIFFFSSNDRFELAAEAAKTLSLYIDTPLFLCNHYGYPIRNRFRFVPRTTFSRLRTNALSCLRDGLDYVNSSLNPKDEDAVSKRRIIAIGQSLGAIPAAYVASRADEVSNLLLISPFTDSDEILKHSLPRGFRWLVNFAIFRPRASIKGCLDGFRGRLRVIIPEDDALVPAESQIQTVEALMLKDAEVQLLPGRDHFGLMGEDDFMRELAVSLKAFDRE